MDVLGCNWVVTGFNWGVTWCNGYVKGCKGWGESAVTGCYRGVTIWKMLIASASNRVTCKQTKPSEHSVVILDTWSFIHIITNCNSAFYNHSRQNIPKSPQFTPEVPKIMYLGIIFFTWPRQTIFIETPPQILGKFLIQFLVLESNREFDTPNSETN